MPAVALEEVLSQVPKNDITRGRQKLVVFSDEQWALIWEKIGETNNKEGVYTELYNTMIEVDGVETRMYPKSISSFNKELNEYLKSHDLK